LPAAGTVVGVGDWPPSLIIRFPKRRKETQKEKKEMSKSPLGWWTNCLPWTGTMPIILNANAVRRGFLLSARHPATNLLASGGAAGRRCNSDIAQINLDVSASATNLNSRCISPSPVDKS